MEDKALIRAILQRISDGEKQIDTTPKGTDSQSAEEFTETMHMLDDKGMIKVKHKHLGGVWDIDGLTMEGQNYLNTFDENVVD